MKKLDSSFFERSRNLVGLSNSLLHHYGVETFHPSCPEIDKLLANHPKVALFLFDGAGESILNTYPFSSRYIRSHKALSIYSVNPATTVACTTALLTGRYPIETGWLGWSLYFKDLKRSIDVFPNEDSKTGEKIPGPNIMERRCPIERLDTLISAKGHKAKLFYQFPIGSGDGPKSIDEGVTMTTDFFQHQKGEFCYFYWTEPDHEIHDYGVKSRHVRSVIRKMAKGVKRFVKENPDVLLLTIADHGLVDVQYRDVMAFPDVSSLLAGPISIEGRTPTFFVKKGKEKEFKAAFERRFPDFALMSRQEALQSGYFGEGVPCAESLSFIGDFVAVSLGRDLIVSSHDHDKINVHIGHHAGGTLAERQILLAAYNS